MIVRYKVKAGRAADNEELIAAVFRQLAREQPAGLRYASFKLEDGLSFLHIASIETADGENPLAALAAFERFTADIRERCDEPPEVTRLVLVGSYRLLDD